MLRKIKLYGSLAKFIGKRVFEADVASAAEAVRFLVANFPAVEKHMADQHYRVSIGTYDLTLDELHDPAGRQEIKIVPVVAGAGGSTGSILAGLAIIALSFGIGAIASAGVTLGGLAGIGSVGTAFVGVGASLVLGGIAQLLAPIPTTPTGVNGQDDPRTNYNFSGIQQTSRAGVSVPLIYGKTLAGSIVISAGIDTEQVQV